ncbi:Laccase-15 [Vitis vinifera]|uniref:laccase n=1 Tax=Vitis vinifera TaxID=29760 RepID=A0A438C701_VITVI|nr:Laccase-15 [Vitis vinifera]
MWLIMKVFLLQILVFQLFGGGIHCQASTGRHTFVVNTIYDSGLNVREASYTRLCSTKDILTVNGQFPGPTIYAMKGETIIVDVYNRGKENVTIHWHGVNMPRYPWTDGPEYITQCPIQPGSKFSQKIILSSEEGTLWWHAHSDWTRATVHGAIIVYPKNGTKYPFHKPNAEFLIILGQWWKSDVNTVRDEGLATGADANASDSLLINGQPGDLFPCSKSGTFKLTVDHGKTYLLRIINAALQEALFFSIAKHKMTVVGTDANQHPDHYYMAARTYSVAPAASNYFDNTTTTAIVMASLRNLADAKHPCNVPLSTSTKLIYTASLNSYPCINNSCSGANGTRFAASINNISFHTPTVDILEAYYYNISGVYGDKFPSVPPLVFNFTADYLPLLYQLPSTGTEVRVLEYNSTVEIVFQGTNLITGNTISVPRKGWVAIKFEASNPGVWFMHCHVDQHLTWGMETAFIVKNGKHLEAQMLPPPSDMPPC